MRRRCCVDAPAAKTRRLAVVAAAAETSSSCAGIIVDGRSGPFVTARRLVLILILLLAQSQCVRSFFPLDSVENPDTVELVTDYVRYLRRNDLPTLTEVPGSDGLTSAYLFPENRPSNKEMSRETTRKVERFFMRHRRDLSVLFAIRLLRPNVVGTIVSIGTRHTRLFEIEYSGRRGELRLHYSHRARVRTEVFRLDLGADNVDVPDTRWHVVAISMSASRHVRVHIDCRLAYERRLPVVADDWVPLDATHADSISVSDSTSTSAAGGGDDGQLRVWLGQRNTNESYFKGAIEYVKLVSSSEGYLLQCPHSDSTCPSCSQFNLIQEQLQQLQSTVLRLTEQLISADRRIAELETCECRRQCRVAISASGNNVTEKWYRDGESVPAVESCTTCTCRSGSVVCERERCPELKCKTVETVEGQCCPVCRKHCVFAGERYEHRQTFNPRPCYSCICQDGKVTCDRQKKSSCPRLTCPRTEQIQLSTDCCKYCRGTNFCAAGNRCHANSSCHNLNTQFVCVCNQGFESSGNSCKDVNECLSPGGHHGHHCHSNTLCVNTIGSYYCQCLPGFEQVDIYTCQDVDECASMTAGRGALTSSLASVRSCDVNAVCVNTPGSYSCRCRAGYHGDGFNCQPVCSQPCRNGGQCVDVNVCRCRHGYMGKNCETDVDECANGPMACDGDVNAECINVPGTYHCRCKAGFRQPTFVDEDAVDTANSSLAQIRLTSRLHCVDVDECSGWGSGHNCPPSTTCRNTVGGYECVCQNSTGSDTPCAECEHEGRYYKANSTWHPDGQPCTTCRCHAGQVQCTALVCNCRRYSQSGYGNTDDDSECCAHCSATCVHQQQPGIAFYVGETWHFGCQRCHCMEGGETDCWPMPCPQLSCPATAQDDDDCCPRCLTSHDPCHSFTSANTSGLLDQNGTLNKTCLFLGKVYPVDHSWKLDSDSCTTCQCLGGNVCCSYNQSCSIASATSVVPQQQQQQPQYPHHQRHSHKKQQQHHHQQQQQADVVLAPTGDRLTSASSAASSSPLIVPYGRVASSTSSHSIDRTSPNRRRNQLGLRTAGSQ